MGSLNFILHEFDSVPSTQQYLAHWRNQEDLPEGTVVVAKDQSSGIGQEGNHWESETGRNLTFSFLLKPESLEPADQFRLNKMISLSVWRCLQKIKGITSPLSVKWPNDLYAGNKKIGGILQSNAVMGNTISYSIIGIGLNINQSIFTDYCPNPTSLYLETGHEQDPAHILDILLESVSCHYHLIQDQAEFLDQKYLDILYQFNEWRPYKILGKPCLARITNVTVFGKLQLEIKDQGLVECDLKEIVYL